MWEFKAVCVCGSNDPVNHSKAKNTAMESFFSTLKTERTARKNDQTRNQAKADVFDLIECFYNPKRRRSTIGYLSEGQM